MFVQKLYFKSKGKVCFEKNKKLFTIRKKFNLNLKSFDLLKKNKIELQLKTSEQGQNLITEFFRTNHLFL